MASLQTVAARKLRIDIKVQNFVSNFMFLAKFIHRVAIQRFEIFLIISFHLKSLKLVNPKSKQFFAMKTNTLAPEQTFALNK